MSVPRTRSRDVWANLHACDCCVARCQLQASIHPLMCAATFLASTLFHKKLEHFSEDAVYNAVALYCSILDTPGTTCSHLTVTDRCPTRMAQHAAGETSPTDDNIYSYSHGFRGALSTARALRRTASARPGCTNSDCCLSLVYRTRTPYRTTTKYHGYIGCY